MSEWEEGNGVAPPLPSPPQSLTRLASFLALTPLFTFLASLRALSKSLNWLDWSFSNWKSSNVFYLEFLAEKYWLMVEVSL